MRVERFTEVKERLLPTFVGDGKHVIARRIDNSGHGVCNGNAVYAGCGHKIGEGNEYYLVKFSGHYWHPHCAQQRGLHVGMVGATPYGVFTTPRPIAESRPYSLRPIDNHNVETLRTQKARGIAVLSRVGYTTPPTLLIQSTDELRSIHSALERMFVSSAEPAWARPCPKRPRHGFLESRAVHTPREVGKLWRDTRRIDPEGELLIQPMVDAKFSGILTPTAFTWGKSNDGATSGHNANVLRLGSTKRVLLTKNTLREAGIDSKEMPFLELVWETPHNPVFVQLRGGPKVAGTLDYIPRKLKVKHVYVLNASEYTSQEALLAWEKLVPMFEKGTVVYHKGGALHSHFGIHCVLNKVPYLTTRRPEVGETLTRDDAIPDSDLNGEILRQGILAGSGIPDAPPERDIYKDNLLTSLFTLHNINADQSEIAARLFGFSASMLFRIMSLACLGEMRHLTDSNDKLAHWTAEYESFAGEHGIIGCARQSVFRQAWHMSHAKLVEAMSYATRGFLELKWAPSMGGLMWGRCALAAMRLHEALTHVVARPSPRSVRNLVQRMNNTTNLVHNNGNLFTKFVSQSEINRAAKLDPFIFVHNVVPRLLTIEKAKPSLLGLNVKPRQWKSAVPRECIRYADNPNSIKRAYDETGSATLMISKQAAGAIGTTFIEVWRRTMSDAIHSVAYALFCSWTADTPTPECSICVKPRSFHAPKDTDSNNEAYCLRDCDDQVRQFNNRRYFARGYLNRMRRMEELRSLETCPDHYIAKQQQHYVWKIKNGNVTGGWVYDPNNTSNLEDLVEE